MSDDMDLTTKLERLPSTLRGIVDEFRSAAPRERLELLIEYAEDLPDLPDHLPNSAISWSRYTSARHLSSSSPN